MALIGFGFFLPSLLWGQSPNLDQEDYSAYITTKFEVLEDPSGGISQSALLNGQLDIAFGSITSDKITAGLTASVFWLKADRKALGDTASIFEVTDPYLSSVSVFYVNEDGSIDSVQNGMIVSLKNRKISSGRIAFQLTPQQPNQKIYIRVESVGPLNFSILAYSVTAWQRSKENRATFFVIFATLFLLVSLASILLWIMRRQGVFLYYLAYVISFGGVLLYGFGYAKELIELPYSPYLIPVFISFSLCSLLGMYRALLSLLEKPFPTLKKHLGLGMLFFVFIGLAYPILQYRWMVGVLLALVPALLLFFISVSYILRKEKSKGLKLFSIGCIFFLFAFTMRALSLFGIAVLPDVLRFFPIFYLMALMIFFLLSFVYQSNAHQKALLRAELKLKDSLAVLESYREQLKLRIPSDGSEEIQHASQNNKTTHNLVEEDLNKLLMVPLSGRELDVLKAVAKGKSNREAGEALFISVNTVKTHLMRIYEKLDVSNRTEAAIKAGQLNLLE